MSRFLLWRRLKGGSLRDWTWVVAVIFFLGGVAVGSYFIYLENAHDYEVVELRAEQLALSAAKEIGAGFEIAAAHAAMEAEVSAVLMLSATGEVLRVFGTTTPETPARFDIVSHSSNANFRLHAGRMLYTGVPFTWPADEAAMAPGYIVVAWQTTELAAHLRSNILKLFFALSIATIVFAMAVLSFLRMVINPIVALRNTMADVLQGSGALADTTRGPRELKDIARTYNDLMQALEQRNQRLDSQRRLLEVKISDLNESERRLRESEDWFRGIFNASMDSMIIIDEHGLIVEANPAAHQLFGYKTGELVNQPVEMLMPADLRPRHQGYVDNYIATGKGNIIGVGPREVEGETKTGSLVVIDLAVSALRLRDKDYFLGALRDATERKQTAQQMERARDLALESARVKDAFLANINHELRTPLNGILGTLPLAESAQDPEERKSYFDIIRTSGQILLDTVSRVLDFARIDAGTLQLDNREFNPQSLVAATVNALGGAITKNLYMLYLAPTDVTMHMEGDPVRMRQAISHVIENAIKFTDHGGVVVTVGVVEQAGTHYMNVVVRDTGCGIAAENLSKVFDRFAQVGKTVSHGMGGTGLGLSTAKKLAQMMGGDLTVQSRAGHGSTFTFKWPVTVDATKLVVPLSPAQRFIRMSVGDAAMHESLTWYLEKLGYQVDEQDKIPYALLASIQRGSPEEMAKLEQFAGLFPGVRMIVLCHARQANLARALLSGREGHILHGPFAGMAIVAQLESAAVQGSAPREATPEAPRVLVVEDNPINQRVLSAMLTRLGLQNELAQNGQEALQKISATNFDLVLMDCLMPVVDGYEATRRIRARNDPRREVPIIAVTANALDGDRDKCLNVGMNDYLAKPVSLESLRTTLQRWMRLPAVADVKAKKPVEKT